MHGKVLRHSALGFRSALIHLRWLIESHKPSVAESHLDIAIVSNLYEFSIILYNFGFKKILIKNRRAYFFIANTFLISVIILFSFNPLSITKIPLNIPSVPYVIFCIICLTFIFFTLSLSFSFLYVYYLNFFQKLIISIVFNSFSILSLHDEHFLFYSSEK